MSLEDTDKAHSRFGGSTADRFVNCPLSVQLCEKMPPQEDTVFTEEGTMLHNVAEQCLAMFKQYRGQNFDLSDYNLTPEQESVVIQYVDYVIARVRMHEDAGREVRLHIEARVRIPDHDEFFGTADAVIVAYCPRREIVLIEVIDFKAGRGVEVDIEYDGVTNRQLGYYALGVYNSLLSPMEQHKARRQPVKLAIVQPRFPNCPKSKMVTLEELGDLKQELVRAAKLAEGKNPPGRAGKWCRFCTAKPICQHHRENIQDMAKEDFAREGGLPEELTVKQLAQLLDDAQVIEAWIASVKSYALHAIQFLDTEIPGWEAVPKRAVRKWKDDRAAIEAIQGSDMKPDVKEQLMPRKPVSPRQMEIICNKYGVDASAVIDELATAESSGAKLAKKGQTEEEEND